jgi:glucose/arabinose dehydrogenase
VSYDYFEDWGDMGAAIVQLLPEKATGQFEQRIVADSTILMRTYGLAVRDGDLFVSRSGMRAKATMGRITYESTGAVTQLKDLDRDGYFEYAHDVVQGLPGARGPDTMQQNNGIAFGPDGSLYVTCGCAANRDLDEHPWGGVILRTQPDFSRTDIFARGFRNPFGIALGPDGELFVTDNDIDENPGDELNHVIEGEHYGHPFVVPKQDHVTPVGFRSPIFVGDLESNLLGLAFATSSSLPEKYRDCLYVTDLMQNTVWRMTLARDEDTYQVTGVSPFATVSSPVDIAITGEGVFYVLSRRSKAIYRIQPGRESTGTVHE